MTTDALKDAQVKKWLAYYRELLALRDWRIDVKFGEASDMPGPGDMACYSCCIEQKAACITILTEAAYNLDPEAYYDVHDIEDALVHELLHLHFHRFFPTRGAARIDAEQAINMISRALVFQRRSAS